MRQHICKRCGKIYLTDKEDSWYCPECARASSSNVFRKKVCATCGVEFIGYPRSKYCPQCRIVAQREAERRVKKNGPARPIGSIDLCENCGKEYTVNSGRQRYCPECAKIVVREKINAAKRAYAQEHKEEINERKRELRRDRRVCVICGKPFTSSLPSVTCSPECEKEYRRQKNAIADAKRGRARPERILSKMTHNLPQSGIPGITWRKKTGKWELKIHGKYIGVFDSIEAAKEKKDSLEKDFPQKQ